ncbi:hypothetical protein RDI58_017589 [Solanum bulbocastanum]|uniref:Amine oxidase domain-containing protein n=1 Tax=Solanum bulbocastanum TaxID=147425 RepID=A0AAN8Y8Z6_SOLBU
MLAMKNRILVEPCKGRVIIIGVGLAGLAATRQLILFGFEVIVFEGQNCAGGRVYNKVRKEEIRWQLLFYEGVF